ncbi:hypothetical protein GBA52_009105 [Prunus armeniaca]|nr:hypothetical protein GBA52_009105 [Prunus armeniaca]
MNEIVKYDTSKPILPILLAQKSPTLTLCTEMVVGQCPFYFWSTWKDKVNESYSSSASPRWT